MVKSRNPLGELVIETTVGNPGCQPGLATSFQLVCLVGCGLNSNRGHITYHMRDMFAYKI